MSDLLPEEIDWGKAWTDAQSRSPMKASEIDRSKWPHFYDVYAGQYLQDVLSGEATYRKIVDFLLREDIFRPESGVLDVGSGPGPFALLFAEQARKVTALDYSAGMLEALAQEAGARGLGNIEGVLSTWDGYSSREKFDLVFSSYSPAVNDERNLLRMEEFSSGHCCFVTAGAPSVGGLFYDMSEAVYGKRPAPKTKIALYPFHLLFSLGRKPGVRFFDTELTITMPAEYLIELSDIYMSIFTVMDDSKRRKIRAWVQSRSYDGLYEKKVSGVAAVIYWDARKNTG